MSGTQPWRDGIWVSPGTTSHIVVITGNECNHKGLAHFDYPDIKADFYGSLEAGDFGDTTDDIRKMSGSERFNVKMKNIFLERKGVLSEEGTRIYMKSFMIDKVEVMELADAAKLKQMREDREPVDVPTLPSYYTPKPNHNGKLIWFSGPPGSGKSTSAQLMARHHGYIYYEGDGFLMFLNPYVDVNVENPSTATFTKQKPLKILKRWREKQEELKKEGLERKETENACVERRKNKDLKLLKGFGGPPNEVDEFLKSTFDESKKLKRMYTEVRYARDTSLHYQNHH